MLYTTLLCLHVTVTVVLKYIRVGPYNKPGLHTLRCLGQEAYSILCFPTWFEENAGMVSIWVDIGSFFVFLIAFAFGIATLFLGWYHISIVFQNVTTLEDGEWEVNPFDLGWKENFLQVFGKDISLWFFPVPSSKGDGVLYPHKSFKTGKLVYPTYYSKKEK